MTHTHVLLFSFFLFSAVCAQAQNKDKIQSKLQPQLQTQIPPESMQNFPENTERIHKKKAVKRKPLDYWRFGALGSTAVGSYSGAGITGHNPHVSFALQMGNIPNYYHGLIADYFEKSSGNSYSKAVAVDSMEKSAVARLDFSYKFKRYPGWFFGGAISKVDSQGKTPLSDALGAATQQDTTVLVDLLEGLGLKPEVEIKTEKIMAELYGGYNWFFTDNLYLGASVGIMKAVNAHLELSAGLGAVEELPGIKQVIDGMEKDFQNSLMEHAHGPIVGLSLGYLF